MPALRLVSGPCLRPGEPPRLHRLNPSKRLVTIGRSADNDLVLDDPQVQASHAYLQLDGSDWVAVAVGGELHVAGKRKSKAKLALYETLRIGGCELVLLDDTAAAALAPPPGAAPAVDASAREREVLTAYRKLYEFSERLLHSQDLDALLLALCDAVLDVTSADHCFLVLLDDNTARPRVQVARNRRRENVADPDDKLSDTIVAKVLRTGQPVMVSDALRDLEFQNAVSVMHLRLSSVLCVPLLEGGQMLGALYVGSSGVGRLFQKGDLELLTVLAAQAALLLRNARLVSSLRSDNKRLGAELEQIRVTQVSAISAGIGSCAAMQEVMRTVKKVAATDVSVLITGETGTGKELIAQELHRQSPRQRGPMVAINCGAIPEQLLESELFGHVRGAFTGAVSSKPGRFQSANGGTVFLDEIGEMPLGLQVKLLRVLQDRAVTRVGDTRPEPVDVRILAATNRDLYAEIRANRFREDLYYRLNVVQIHLPPLRERGDDVLLLSRYFLRRFADELHIPPRSLSPAAEQALRRHPFPGNIRQLENHVRKALVLCDREVLEPEDLGLVAAAPPPVLPLGEAKERFAQKYIGEVLAQCGGNRTRTAQLLGIDPRTLFRFLAQQRGEGAKDGDAEGDAPAHEGGDGGDGGGGALG